MFRKLFRLPFRPLFKAEKFFVKIHLQEYKRRVLLTATFSKCSCSGTNVNDSVFSRLLYDMDATHDQVIFET